MSVIPARPRDSRHNEQARLVATTPVSCQRREWQHTLPPAAGLKDGLVRLWDDRGRGYRR
jgi:hypothetical protein